MSASLLNRTQAQALFAGGLVTAYDASIISRLCGEPIRSIGSSQRYSALSSPDKAAAVTGARGSRQQLKASPFDVPNVIYSNSIEIPAEAVMRDARSNGGTGQIQQLLSELAGYTVNDQLEVIDTRLANGDVSGSNSYIGTKFFNTSATVEGQASFINDVTSSQVGALDVSSTGSVTAEEAADIIMGMIAHMKGFTDSGGRLMHRNTKEFAVLVPAALYSPFNTAVFANNLAGGETNPLKAFNVSVHEVNVDWTLEVAVAAVSHPRKPFRLQVEVDPTLYMTDESNDAYIADGKYIARYEWIGNVAYGEPRCIVKGLIS